MEKVKKLWTIFITMAKIGMFTFGGGWSIIAQIQNEFVDKRGWITEEQLVDYMSLAKSFPGIMIINMSVFCGYTMCGVVGAVTAAVGLSAPAVATDRGRDLFLFQYAGECVGGKDPKRREERCDPDHPERCLEAEADGDEREVRVVHSFHSLPCLCFYRGQQGVGRGGIAGGRPVDLERGDSG